jgi:hypothetical protein
MTILETTRQIIAKHKLAEKLDLNPFKERRKGQFAIFSEHPKLKDSDEFSERLQAKYESRIPSGWYGFDTYQWPINWLNALEEFLAELEKDSPDFEIHQNKLKYGGARLYYGNISSEAEKAIDLLESAMFDENLIY